MRGISIFQKQHYREFRTMRGRPMRGLPVFTLFEMKFGEVRERYRKEWTSYNGGNSTN